MGNENAHINYSLADIEKYLQGKMNATEMHELERAALQDAFLADAIEGYSEATNATSRKHLADIEQLLNGGKKEAKIVTIQTQSKKWWKVAASVIIIMGAGTITWLAMNKNNNESKQELALNTNAAVIKADSTKFQEGKKEVPSFKPEENIVAKEKQNKALLNKSKENDIQQRERIFAYKAEHKSAQLNSETEAMKIDSIPASYFASLNGSVAANEKYADTILLQKRNTAFSNRSFDAKVNRDSVNFNNDVAKAITGRTAGVNVNAADKNITANNFISQPTLSNELRGRVMNSRSQPVGYSTINAGNQYVVSDANGYFNFRSTDTAVNSTINSIGYGTENVQLSSNRNNVVILNESKESLAEVVTLNYASEKKEQSAAMKTKTVPPAKPQTIDSLVTPIGGWDAFHDYVRNQIRYEKNIDTTYGNVKVTRLKGNDDDEVELEFLVDKEGTPTNIKVVKSANAEEDTKAIEVLKKGPRWTSKQKKAKGKVTIKFNP
jgi:TonB family protein